MRKKAFKEAFTIAEMMLMRYGFLIWPDTES